LKIAREFEDRSAERRAHSNLGNANIFLGEFEKAAEHYKQTLLLAQVQSGVVIFLIKKNVNISSEVIRALFSIEFRIFLIIKN